MPNAHRERLRQYTEHWINPVLNSLDNLTAPESLSVLYELNWRLEKCLLPIPDARAAEKYRQTLARFNPFPAILAVGGKAEFQPDNAAARNLNSGAISREWTELAFALMRNVRENFDDPAVDEYVEKLRKIVRHNDDWQSRWFYERCLFALFRLDHEKAREISLEWGNEELANEQIEKIKSWFRSLFNEEFDFSPSLTSAL